MKKIVNTHKGFTLAEILISLVILGVIAALTIPTLIQNTHKKEEVVKIKKGLSMINQAISMNYALTGEDLSKYNDGSAIKDMFKKRMSVVSESSPGNFNIFKTQDGLAYLIDYITPEFDPSREISPSNYNLSMELYTLQLSPDEIYGKLMTDSNWQQGTLGNLSGRYVIYCGYDRCVPSPDTAAIMNASDPTKTASGS